MAYTLKIGNTEACMSAWKVSEFKIGFANASRDTAKIRLADASPFAPVAVDDILELFKDGTRVFRGRITKAPETNSAKVSNVCIEAASPWLDLDRIVYQQAWASLPDSAEGTTVSSVMRSKVVLGQNPQGNAFDVEAQLRDILNYAAGAGADLQIGTISVSANMLQDEACDISCAEALLRVLKWIPNTSAWFDYSGSGAPSLNIAARANLECTTLNAKSGLVKNLSVSPRPDLAASGVSVKYERENSRNGYVWTTVEEDCWPPNFNSAQRNAIVMSVDLNGCKCTSQSYTVKCETIQPDSVAWWRNRVPALSDATSIVIKSHTRISALARELTEGTLDSRLNFEAEDDTVTALLEYTESDGTKASKTVGVKIVATNAASGTYAVWETSQYAETKPAGLPKAIYDAVCDLQYEGNAEIISALPSQFSGRRLNITGFDSAWQTMKAPVVSMTWDIFAETLKLRFGPPKHLYPDEISELFRINRTCTPSSSGASRASAKIRARRVVFEGKTAAANGSQGDAKYARFLVCADESKNVDIDASLLDASEHMLVRKILVCKDGKPAYAKFLATEPTLL